MVLEKLSLEGKVAIVTGGGTGLGRAMSHALARAGADIVLAARRPYYLERTAREIQGLGRCALAVPTDVTSSRQVNAMVAKALDAFGHLDILVNNAGIVRDQHPKPIWEIADWEWHLGLNTNLTGAFFCARAVVKHLIERKKGKIINLASGLGMRGVRDNYMYCIAKGGVIQLTKAMALTWAQHGIQVNGIAPGRFAHDPPRGPTPDPERMSRRADFLPTGRFGLPQEIGPLAVFLASDASDYMTGETIIIDGAALAAGYAPTGYTPGLPL